MEKISVLSKRKLGLGSGILGLILAAGITSAYAANTNSTDNAEAKAHRTHLPPPAVHMMLMDEDQRSAIDTALENDDYDTWAKLMTEATITAEHFETMQQFHQDMKDGKLPNKMHHGEQSGRIDFFNEPAE